MQLRFQPLALGDLGSQSLVRLCEPNGALAHTLLQLVTRVAQIGLDAFALGNLMLQCADRRLSSWPAAAPRRF